MLPLSYIYEDTKLVVVNKPRGLLSVPGKGEQNQDSVETRIRAKFPECTKIPTVHRLDMDTSGLLVYGLTKRAKKELSEQFQNRQVSKRYVALIEGQIKEEGGTILLPLRMDLENRPYSVVDHENGKPAHTEWRNLGIEGQYTRVEFILHTGRTHQLRLHALYGLGFPIVGDRLYGNGTQAGQMKLHAGYLRFVHPKTKDIMEFHSEPNF